jgi:hypothetical protein
VLENFQAGNRIERLVLKRKRANVSVNEPYARVARLRDFESTSIDIDADEGRIFAMVRNIGQQCADIAPHV